MCVNPRVVCHVLQGDTAILQIRDGSTGAASSSTAGFEYSIQISPAFSCDVMGLSPGEFLHPSVFLVHQYEMKLIVCSSVCSCTTLVARQLAFESFVAQHSAWTHERSSLYETCVGLILPSAASCVFSVQQLRFTSVGK